MPLTNFGYVTDGDAGAGASVAYVNQQISEATASVVRNVGAPDAANINSVPMLTSTDGRVLKRSRITIDETSPLGDVVSFKTLQSTDVSTTDLDVKRIVTTGGSELSVEGNVNFDSAVVATNGFRSSGPQNLKPNLAEIFQDGKLLTYRLSTDEWIDAPVSNFGTTQYSKDNLVATDFEAGFTLNGCTFFTDADKSASGTLAGGEITLAYGIDFRATRLANNQDLVIKVITINPPTNVNYATPDQGNAFDTMQLWVTNHKLNLANRGVSVFWNPNANGGLGAIRFCSDEVVLNSIVLVVTGTPTGWSAVRVNPFTKFTAAGVESTTAVQDHFLIPYVGQPYENQHIQHRFRVNFNLDYDDKDASNCALGLYRYEDDSLVASEITLERRKEEKGSTIILGQQHVFVTFTAGSTDPFVQGGFYFAIRNPPANPTAIIEVGNVGILLQSSYQQPVRF